MRRDRVTFWTPRRRQAQLLRLEEFCARSPQWGAQLESERGLFARSFPVGRGRWCGRELVVGFGSNGYATNRSATITHTVFTYPGLGGLPAGLRVFPGARGRLIAKGSSMAKQWLAERGRLEHLDQHLRIHGYVAVSEAEGLRIHLPGVLPTDDEIRHGLDLLTDLSDALE